MLTVRSGAAGGLAAAAAMAAHLNQQTLPAAQLALAEYYAGGPERQARAQAAIDAGMHALPTVRADIDPVLAKALAVQGDAILDNEQLAHVLRGQAADGEDLPGAQRGVRRYEAKDPEAQDRHRVSYTDLTFSAPKKVSVAWYAAKTQAERHSILEAHRTAVEKTLRHIEREVAIAGFGEGHRKGGHEQASMAWVRVDHFTSRPTATVTRADPVTGVVDTELYDIPGNGLMCGDPQLHSHCIVPNILRTESGRFVSMSNLLFHGRIHEFGATYQMLLGAELRKLGIDVQLDRDPKKLCVDLPAIPDAVAREFSKRTERAEDAAREMARANGLDWDSLDPDRKVRLLKGRSQAGRLGKGDDLASWEAWDAQAARLIAEGKWWRHESAVAYGPPAPEWTRDQRFEHGYEVGLDLLEPNLDKRAVVSGADVRTACARALIDAGAEGIEDISTLARGMVRQGVRQAGQMTKMLWREAGFQRVKVTTELHVNQEAEVIGLAREAGAARSRAIPADLIAQTLAEAPVDYASPVGQQQRAVVERLAAGGAAQVFLGVAGAGKTEAILAPLVKAWEQQQRDVWGVANAWKIARGLKKSGIGSLRTRALQPFLDGVEAGRTVLTERSVVVLDELSQIGTRQLLHLLRLRERIGFGLVMTGDERQAQSVEAGPVIELLRRGFGAEAIPEILDTIRQRTEREREIAGLFRKGDETETARAIGMKREDGHAELAPGTYLDCCRRVAALWMDRLRATEADPEYSVTISAPSNADALAISREVRGLLQADGRVSGQEVERDACDGAGNLYSLALAVGDRVRLFQVTRGLFTDESGRRKDAHVGDNGSVLTVRGIQADGLRLETEAGKVALVRWDRLQDRATGRLKLAYGYCLTIDSAQGITSDEHILAMPAGSKAVQAFKAYVGASRHRVASFIVGSKGAEMMEVGERRPIGPRQPVSEDDAWKNVARNLARAPLKELATDMLAAVAHEAQAAGRSLRRVSRYQEARAAAGHALSTLRDAIGQQRAREAMAAVIDRLEKAIRDRAPLLAQLHRAVDVVKFDVEKIKLEQTYRLTVKAVAHGTCRFSDGLESLIAAEYRNRAAAAPMGVVHKVPQLGIDEEAERDLEERVEARFNELLDAYMEEGEASFHRKKLTPAEVRATLEWAARTERRPDPDLGH